MRHHRAFTLIELLVVVAIIGVLVGLLLPAVQAARESARRMHCANNLKQVGLALQSFHEAHEAFPAGNFAQTAGVCPGSQRPGIDAPSEDRANWMISILSYLEEKGLYEAYDQTTYNEARENGRVRERSVATYLCPSDVAADEPIVPALGPASEFGLNVPYMPGSYRGAAGRSDGQRFLDWSLDVSYPRRWRGPLHVVGVLGFVAESLATIEDGSSNTLMVGESTTRTGLPYRTLWAYSYAFYSLSSTTPQARTLWADYDRCRSAGGDGLSLPCRRGWGSLHAGGLNFLLCDGAVRFIDRGIDVRLFADLGTIAGRESARLPP
jgi:prepilin-type N-terminal cleavage/methylation domain-containing protein/prepilin-type processing-associated H-X9-DG protein